MQPKLGWRRLSYSLLATRLSSWLFSRLLPPVDSLIFRLSGGKQTAVSAIAGLPSIILTTTGAKSGEPRHTALLGFPDGERFIVIASNWGGKHHPGWYYNLRAHPSAEVSYNGKTANYTARETTGAEREQCWNKALQYYEGYNAYQQRTERKIHVLILEPKN